MLEILSYPFFHNALISMILLSSILSILGIFLILKRGVFIADALAHSSLLGVGLSFLVGLNYFFTTLFYLILCAILIFLIEKKSLLNYDLLIMIMAILGIAGGVLILSTSFAKSSLISFLFGNILLIDKLDVIVLFLIFSAVLTLFKLYGKDTLLTFINKDLAYTENIKVDAINLFFIIILSIVIGVSIKMIGVLLVSSLLVLPVSISKLISQSFKGLVLNSILWAELIGINGLFISYFLNLPPGPVIAFLGILILAIFLTIKNLNVKILK